MPNQTLVFVCSLFLFFAYVLANNSLNKVLYNGDYDFIDLTYPFDNQTIYWLNTQEFEFTKKNASFQSDGSCLNKVLYNGDYDFIDLTYPFDNQTIYWLNTQEFEFTKKNESFQSDGSWYAANDFAAGEHGGTHIDAPYHFSAAGLSVGQIPLDKLIVPLVIADIASKVNDDPNFILYKHHLDYMLKDNMGQPCLIVFKFGWSKFFLDKNKYLGINNGQLNFPGLSAEVAEWIVSSYKNVVGVGVDVASVDPGSTTDFPVHKILSKAGLYNVENVNLPLSIPAHGCTAFVMPMKIAQGSGAPVRLVAICPKHVPEDF